jgi:hypothetical protein
MTTAIRTIKGGVDTTSVQTECCTEGVGYYLHTDPRWFRCRGHAAQTATISSVATTATQTEAISSVTMTATQTEAISSVTTTATQTEAISSVMMTATQTEAISSVTTTATQTLSLMVTSPYRYGDVAVNKFNYAVMVVDCLNKYAGRKSYLVSYINGPHNPNKRVELSDSELHPFMYNSR